jgi:DNA-binding GntR family transcriptional regulator
MGGLPEMTAVSGAKPMLHDEVVARLRDMLVEGTIPPGARVPERELCLAFGISRTPLREALKVLAAEGHVTLLPNRGARAAKLTAKDVHELFELCAGLESMAGELACERIDQAALERILALHAEMTRHYGRRALEDYFRCNRMIHEAIVAAAGNAVLSAVYDQVTARIRRARFRAPMPPTHWELAIQEHEAIANALVRRDGAGLAHILRRHLRNKLNEIKWAGFAETDDAPARPKPAARRAAPLNGAAARPGGGSGDG